MRLEHEVGGGRLEKSTRDGYQRASMTRIERLAGWLTAAALGAAAIISSDWLIPLLRGSSFAPD